jgi:glycerophosphoryl diester phosphodiesterase
VISVFAHRGASRAEPENTIAAFRRAKEMGADGVELDVRRHESGVLAIAHDAVFGTGPLDPSVPVLAEALDACAGLVVNIEIKNFPGDPDHDPTEELAARVVDLLHERGGRDDVFISSFSMSCINRVRELDPSLSTAFLVLHAPDDDVIGRIVDRTRRHGHQAVNPHHGGVTPRMVELAHAAGLRVHTWTVDDPDRMRELASWGVDSVITNVPDLALAALRS